MFLYHMADRKAKAVSEIQEILAAAVEVWAKELAALFATTVRTVSVENWKETKTHPFGRLDFLSRCHREGDASFAWCLRSRWQTT